MAMRKLIALLALVVSACTETNGNSPLIFGQGVTVGISVGASPTAANTPDITIGVKQADLAIVPTVVPKDVPLANKDSRMILANGVPEKGGSSEYDALSTFGSFSNTTKTGEVQLGIFFATGIAAQNLSRGFQCGVSKGTHYECKGQ